MSEPPDRAELLARLAEVYEQGPLNIDPTLLSDTQLKEVVEKAEATQDIDFRTILAHADPNVKLIRPWLPRCLLKPYAILRRELHDQVRYHPKECAITIAGLVTLVIVLAYLFT